MSALAISSQFPEDLVGPDDTIFELGMSTGPRVSIFPSRGMLPFLLTVALASPHKCFVCAGDVVSVTADETASTPAQVDVDSSGIYLVLMDELAQLLHGEHLVDLLSCQPPALVVRLPSLPYPPVGGSTGSLGTSMGFLAERAFPRDVVAVACLECAPSITACRVFCRCFNYAT
jgi:hypothetical protein